MVLLIEILSEYSLWLIIPCILLGLGYAFLMYRKASFLNEVNRFISYFLFILRFLVVSIISFLLINPLIKTISKQTEKPIIIWLQDNSLSVVSNKDSNYYRKIYPEKVKNILEKFSENYEVKTYSFGKNIYDSLIFSYTERQTDISTVLKKINEYYFKRNIGAIILATDGIYNRGENPVNIAERLNYPIYTIALGDTTIVKDIFISNVRYNKTVHKDNIFPIEINIRANKLKGNSTEVSVFENNQNIYNKQININSNKYNEKIIFTTEAKKTGIYRYSIKISNVKGESILQNNYKDIFIEVIDANQKVLILYNSPHPDIGTLRRTIEQNQNYSVKAIEVSEFKEKTNDYDLIIFHQIPSEKKPSLDIISNAEKNKISTLFILGRQSSLRYFNDLKIGLNIISKNVNTYNDAYPAFNQNFSLFTLSDNFKRFLSKLPPLQTFFGNFNVYPTTSIMMYQKIGNVETQMPLILFEQKSDIRKGVIVGEGIWRWNMIDFLQNGNNNLFRELVNKILQYLSVRIDKSQFRVLYNNRIDEDEPLQIEAELYNDAYELINTPEVMLELVNETGKKYNYIFNKSEKSYYLNIGILPSGNYRFVAKTKLGNKEFVQKGEIIVSPLDIEKSQIIADHILLSTLSARTNGKMFYPNNIDSVYIHISNREDVKPTYYVTKRYSDFISFEWLFFLILLLLTTEWLIRKRSGEY